MRRVRRIQRVKRIRRVDAGRTSAEVRLRTMVLMVTNISAVFFKATMVWRGFIVGIVLY
jgi:hypothetical protein